MVALLCQVLVACGVQVSNGRPSWPPCSNAWLRVSRDGPMTSRRAAQAAAEWPQVQEAVAKLCLAWWQAEAPGRAALVPQTLPYLLVRALTGAPRRGRALEGFPGGCSQSVSKQAHLDAWPDWRISGAASLCPSTHS